MQNYYSTFTYYDSKYYYESPVKCENIALTPRASISAENHQQSAIAFIVAFITMKTWTNSPRGAVNSKVNFRGKARKCETAFAPLKERGLVAHAERNHVITNSGVEIRGRRWLKRWSTVRKRGDFSECKLLFVSPVKEESVSLFRSTIALTRAVSSKYTCLLLIKLRILDHENTRLDE